MRLIPAMLVAILHVALGASAYGHHSHFYDECKSIAIEGRVERVEFKNPHNVIVLRLDDGATYAVDWLSVTRLGEVLVCRYLGYSSEAAKRFFSAAWAVLRQAVSGRRTVPPRIWAT